MSRRTMLPAFTPTAVPAADLVARTVGREDAVQRIVASIRAAATSGERPHVLVVGPRGSGKTHLLQVVVHEACSDDAVSGRLAVVSLPEDAPGIVSYQDLLYAIVERLIDDAGPDHAETQLAAALEARRDPARLEQMIVRLLDGRVLVLVLENLDRVFKDFRVDGQRSLRAFTETSQQVMLLASAPLLVESLSDHGQPWYGAFNVEHLADLTAEEGGELLRRFAVEARDGVLAAFLDTPRAQGRLEAVAHLTGGSPRMWTVLAGCLTIELLDELVPLVEALLDELVPYYQERLNSLAPNERKLVVELCRSTRTVEDGNVVVRPPGIFSVSQLAEHCGMDKAVATTSLNRLHDARWVRRRKPSSADGRSTWYEIREPMLRHHLQHRDSRGETLQVIVAFLREWYSPMERRQYFAAAKPESIAERYLYGLVIADRAPATDGPYADADLEQLLVEARLFLLKDASTLDEQEKRVRSGLAGIAAEAAVLTVQQGRPAASEAARARIAKVSGNERRIWQEIATAAIDEIGTDASVADEDHARALVSSGLSAAFSVAEARATNRRDVVALGLLAAGWRGACGEDADALADLEHIASAAREIDDWQLRLAVEGELAYFAWQEGQQDRAMELGTQVLEERETRLGDKHPDTLTSSSNIAFWSGERGDYRRAADLFARVIEHDRHADRESGWGVYLRYQHAFCTGQSGEFERAVELLTEVIADSGEIYGHEDPQTLDSRHGHAFFVAQTGRHEEALALYEALVPDFEAVFGKDNLRELEVRRGFSLELSATGDHAQAQAVLVDLIADYARLLGPDDKSTVVLRYQHAVETGRAGERDRAVELLMPLLDDLARVFGADDGNALNGRQQLAYAVAETGDFTRARQLYADVIADYERVFGPTDILVLSAKASMASVMSTMGDQADAVMMVANALDGLLTGPISDDDRLDSVRSRLAVLVAGLPTDVATRGPDDPARRALDRVFDVDPFTALVGRVVKTLELHSPKLEETVRQLAAMASAADALPSLDVTAVSAARNLDTLSPDERDRWTDVWAAELSGIAGLGVGARQMKAIGAALRGDDGPLLSLPAEERAIARGVIGDIGTESA